MSSSLGFYSAHFFSLYGVDTASNVDPCLSKAERTDILLKLFGPFSVHLFVLIPRRVLASDTMQTLLLNYVFKLSAAD